MNEIKLRFAIRDLYRGDGGPLNELDQGWNEGVDAAAEILYPLVERAEGGDMSDTPRTDAAVVSAEYIRREMDYYEHKFILADHARDLERENVRLREALRVCDLALSKVSDGSTSNEFRKVYVDALRDAGVSP